MSFTGGTSGTHQIAVLKAVVRRLISELEELNERNCYMSLDPEPPPNASPNFCVQVSPADGQFDESAFDGGAENVLIENSGVSVTIMMQHRADQVRHAEILLYGPSPQQEKRSLLEYKRRILVALSGHMLVDDNGADLLVDLMMPVRAQTPIASFDGWSMLPILFSAPFMWEMS